MRDIDIPAFRKEIIHIVEANRDMVSSLEAADDYSIFTFCGKNYACEITLNTTWIGIDLEIDTPENTVGCGYALDTDLYSLDYNKMATLEIYDQIILVIKALFTNKFFYTCNEKFSYVAVENNNGNYIVHYLERKKFLLWSYTSGWSRNDYTKSDLLTLGLQVLS